MHSPHTQTHKLTETHRNIHIFTPFEHGTHFQTYEKIVETTGTIANKKEKSLKCELMRSCG